MELLQLENIKSQCKLNNDYKSLAAVARLQRNTVVAAQNTYLQQKDNFFNIRNQGLGTTDTEDLQDKYLSVMKQ